MAKLTFFEQIFFSGRKKKKILEKKHAEELAKIIRQQIGTCPDRVPIIIISYNNIRYVLNLTEFLAGRGFTPVILDNASTDPETHSGLKKIAEGSKAVVIQSPYNFGHMVGFRPEVYPIWPEIFAYTDPDLELNSALPGDFIEILTQLTDKFRVFKAGFALDLGRPGELGDLNIEKTGRTPFNFKKSYSVAEWEGQFWTQKLEHPVLEVYAAPIDTTFAVYNKKQYNFNFLSAVRVAGPFSAVHLPWFPRQDIMTPEERKAYYQGNISASWLP